MQYSRAGIVAVLLAVEAFLVGAMIWSLGGRNASAQSAGMHGFDTMGHAFAPIDAGTAPRVIVDDPDAGLAISNSTDGKVHVTDDSHIHGWIFGNHTRPALSVQTLPGGVSIERPGGQNQMTVLGFDYQHVTIAVPPQSNLEVRRCSGAHVTGLRGAVHINSVDGRIVLSDIRATALFLRTADGSLRFSDVSAPSIDAATQDGSIHADGLQVDGGTLATQDGSITVGLPNASLKVSAHTADGTVRYNGQRMPTSDDSSNSDFTVGSGGGQLALTTQDGSINITTNGAQ